MSEFSRSMAFIIGINNYTNGIYPLQNAENDAKKLVELLREKHNYQVWVCLNQFATLNNLNKLLEKTLPEQVSENDRLLFYFAGHGIALNGDDGPEGYLIPQDAKLHDTKTYLPMAKLQECLEKLPCRHFLGILDCCFAGAFRWSSNRDLLTAPEVIHKERYDRFITDPAWQVITSAASDQKALDAFNFNTERGQTGNHSPFAAALIEALEGKADIYPPSTNGKPPGDGVITATELYLYLRDVIEPATEEHLQRQTPGIWPLKKHDKGEYIFLSPGHPLNLPPAPPLDASKNPYRGLKSFEEKHSKLFFGRTELVEKLDNFVKIHPLTVVLGASGSGKSSLVKAGLIPQLRQETTEEWHILAPIRPGENPLVALNNALKNAQLPELADQNPQHNLVRSIDVWAKNHPNSKLLLFIDQSEEIITLCQNEDERKEFFQEILKAINAHRDRLRVVLSLRSDFEPQVRDAGLKFVPTVLKVPNTALKNRWQTGRFIVPAMTRGELREAIEKPAEARVMYFQPHELVEQLIDEVADMPGALPLLSFALSELYLKYLKRQWDAENKGITIDRSLTQEDYQDLGGVIQSLRQRADEEYEALVKENPAYAQIIRHVMLRMVALGGGELARRQVPLSELEYPPEKNDLAKEVIERFTKARLLVKGEDAEANPYLEPAHDALVRSWQRLLNWVKEEKNLRLQRRLTPAALEWKSQQQARFLWNADPYLDVLHKDVLNSENNWLNKVETEFVQRSVEKKSFNTKRNWGIAIAVMLGLTGLTIWAKRNSQLSDLRARAAEVNNLTSVKPIDALLQSIDTMSQPLSESVFEVRSSLLSAVETPKELNKKELTQEELTQEVNQFSSNPPKHKCGRRVVTGDNNTLRLSIGGKQIGDAFKGHDDFVTSVAFSPDCKFIVSGSRDNSLRLWNLDGNQIGQPLQGHESWIIRVTVSPDSNSITSSSKDGTIRLWDVKKENLIRLLSSENRRRFAFSEDRVALSEDGKVIIASVKNIDNENRFIDRWYRSSETIGKKRSDNLSTITAIAITDDGEISVSAGKDGKINLWDREGNLIDSNKINSDQKTISAITAIAIAPDGKSVVSGTNNGIIQLWNIQNKKLEQSPQQLNCSDCRRIGAIVFSQDGEFIAIGSYDNSVRLWNRNDNSMHKLQGEEHTLPIESIAFSHDGNLIASGSRDNTVRLWNTKTHKQIGQPLKGHKGWVSAIAFSPDDKFIATGSWDKTVRLWDSNGHPMGSPFRGHTQWISSVRFSSNGKSIISGSDYDTVRWWQAGNQEDWLKKACSQLRNHPVFQKPKNSLEEGVKKTCQKYN